MHFDDSVESTAGSDLEDGELQKMLTSPLYAQKALVKPDALFSPEQGNLTRSSVFINANPSNLKGSLLEGNKDHLPNQARSDLAKQELHVESLHKCIGDYNDNDHTITGCDQSRRDQLLFQEELSQQNRALRETRIRNMRDMEELQKSHVLKVEELSRRILIEDQNTIMELRAKIQELQNEVNCMNDSRDFKDAESVRRGPSHVPSQPAFFPPYRDPG